MSNVDLAEKPPELSIAETLARIEAKVDAQGRAVAFMLANMTRQPAQIGDLQELLDSLGREMPGSVVPASGLVLGS